MIVNDNDGRLKQIYSDGVRNNDNNNRDVFNKSNIANNNNSDNSHDDYDYQLNYNRKK